MQAPTTAKTSVTFKSPAAVTEQDLAQRLKDKDNRGQYLGAVIYDSLPQPTGEFKGIVHIGNPYADNPVVTSIYTRCTKSEFEDILNSAVWMEETCVMFELLASNYHNRSQLLFEGESSLGKTFCSALFFKFIYGPKFDPLNVTVDQFMEGKDLLAKWVPRDPNNVDLSVFMAVDKVLESDSEIGRAAKKKIDDIQTKLTGLPASIIEKVMRGEKLKIADELNLLSEGGEWVREPGEIVKSFTGSVAPDGTIFFPEDSGSGGNGDGLPLLIDELSRGKPSVTNIFLQCRGKGRRLTESLAVLDMGSKRILRGKNAFFVYTQNPVGEDFEGTNPIDPALARGVVYVRLKPMSDASYKLYADNMLRFKTGGRPEKMPNREPFNYETSSELISEISDLLTKFHLEFKTIVGKAFKSKDQKIPTTLDDMSTFAQQLYMHPVINGSSGEVDVAQTFRRAAQLSYMLKIQDDKKLFDTMEARLESLLTSKELGSKRFRGKTMTRAQILNELGGEIALDPTARLELTRVTVKKGLDDLGKDASLPSGLRGALGDLGSLIN